MAQCHHHNFLLVSGFGQNAGKTTVACSILESLRKKHYRVRAFKLGADPVDASLLSSIAGHICYNLDPYLMTAQDIFTLLVEGAESSDFVIIEATLGINSDLTSSFRKMFPIATLYVQSYSGRSAYLVELISPNIGAPQKADQFVFDTESPSTSIARMIKFLGQFATCIPIYSTNSDHEILNIRRQILVAADKAFGVVSQNNFRHLLSLGDRVRPFSPLSDKQLTFKPACIYFGSGNITPYLSDLSRNTCILKQLRKFVAEGISVYADGDAIAYLLDFATDRDGQRWEMLGILPGFSKLRNCENSHGYCIAQSIKDNLLCKAGKVLHVYFDSELEAISPLENCFHVMTPDNKYVGMDGFQRGNVLATQFRTFGVLEHQFWTEQKWKMD
jgi:cobyrinic acid a,c-diamide synthase